MRFSISAMVFKDENFLQFKTGEKMIMVLFGAYIVPVVVVILSTEPATEGNNRYVH